LELVTVKIVLGQAIAVAVIEIFGTGTCWRDHHMGFTGRTDWTRRMVTAKPRTKPTERRRREDHKKGTQEEENNSRTHD